ncbi:hypothetical protein DE146DRAFT_768620 [Phaeosphaeria sp. MPI-PUGE-AT-0046c]|nr:hypothetical protein DE146DRAFT_768620 [Phaeosphaeria sp. MPI-PUGE-AT-0046c]
MLDVAPRHPALSASCCCVLPSRLRACWLLCTALEAASATPAARGGTEASVRACAACAWHGMPWSWPYPCRQTRVSGCCQLRPRPRNVKLTLFSYCKAQVPAVSWAASRHGAVGLVKWAQGATLVCVDRLMGQNRERAHGGWRRTSPAGLFRFTCQGPPSRA